MPSPSLRTVSRLSGSLAVALALAATALTLLAPSASALAQQRITLSEGEIKEVSFGPIPGNNPAGDLHTPEQCNTSAYCDTVPVTVVRPASFDETQDYFVQFQLSWDSPMVPDALEPSGERALNDLDMYIYNDPIVPTAGEDQDGAISRGASGGEPEIAYLSLPNGNYSVVIVNYVGANTGYTLKLTWVSESIGTPFESLAPGYTPPPSTQSGPPPVVTPPSTGTFDAPPLAAPSLEVAPIEPDTSFDSGFDSSSSIDVLAAPPNVEFRPASVSKPRPPSGLALVLWMLVLPLAGVALGGAWLSRRSANLLRI